MSASTTRRLRRVSLAACALALGACAPLRSALSGTLVPGAGSPEDLAARPGADVPPPDDPQAIPLEDDADWIQLKSGEWLRGRVVRIRRGRIDFSSDELGALSFALSGIRRLRTHRSQDLVLKDGAPLRGPLVLDGDDLWVLGAAESEGAAEPEKKSVRIDRDEVLVSLGYEGDAPVDWTRRLTFGATARSGNTQQTDVSLFGEITRETARTRWRTTYNGATSRASGTETANNHRLQSLFDVYLADRLFATVPTLDLYRDRFQNIALRVAPAALVGYEVVRAEDHAWRVSLGPGYQFTEFYEVAPGDPSSDSTAAVNAQSRYTWHVTGDVDFSFDYTLVAAVPDTDEYNHNFVLRLSAGLVGSLDLDVAFVWDRVNRPVSDADGNVPVSDDYRTTIGLGWSF